MSQLPPCPQCKSEFTYEDGAMLVCPECGHEWSPSQADAAEETRVVKDSVGNVLQDGDTVTVIKDLKLKGSSLVVKVGTKVRNIRLVDGDHDIDCKVDGFGAIVNGHKEFKITPRKQEGDGKPSPSSFRRCERAYRPSTLSALV